MGRAETRPPNDRRRRRSRSCVRFRSSAVSPPGAAARASSSPRSSARGSWRGGLPATPRWRSSATRCRPARLLVVLILDLRAAFGCALQSCGSVFAFALRRGAGVAGGATAYIAAQIVGGIVGVWTAHLMFELPVMAGVVEPVRSGAGQSPAESRRNLWGRCSRFWAARTMRPPPYPTPLGSTSPRPIGSLPRHPLPIRR